VINKNQSIESIVYENDEISFHDLWMNLVLKKKLIAVCTALFLTMAIFYTFLSEKSYRFTTSIQLAIIDGKDTLIESPETVKGKLETAYIQLVLSEYRQTENDDLYPYEINVTIPKSSRILVLNSKGKLNEERVFLDLHRKIVEKLRQSHRRVLDVYKKNLELTASRAKIKLDRLKDLQKIGVEKKKLEFSLQKQRTLLEEFTNPKIFEARKKTLDMKIKKSELGLETLVSGEKLFNLNLERLSDNRMLLEKELIELQPVIKIARQQYLKAQADVHSKDRALLLLMIGNDLQLNRQSLSALEDKLYIQLVKQEEEMQKKISDNQSMQSFQMEEVLQYKAELTRFLALKESKSKELSLKLEVIEAQKSGWKSNIRNQILEQENVYNEIDFRINSLDDTQAIVPPMRSIESISLSKKVVLILMLFLGLFVGVVVALISTSFDVARSRS